MTMFQRAIVWYKICNKRLLRKFSFVLLLILIPIIVPITHNALSGESSVLKVAVSSEDNSPAALRAKQYLEKTDSIIEYIQCENISQARTLVAEHKVDAAWVFKSNLEDRINSFVLKKNIEPFIKIIEREETTILKLSREMLYGAVYNEVSVAIYKNHALENLDNVEKMTDNDFRAYYDSMERNGQIIEFTRLSSDALIEKHGYLTGPTRGILSLFILIAALAAAMYYLKDQSEGKYEWLPYRKRIIPAFALCLAATLMESAAVYIALIASGISKGVLYEFVVIFLFVIAATGFALNFCVIFRSYGKLGAILPGIVVVALILSPIFFDVELLLLVRLLLPTHYYLNSIYDPAYILYTVIYVFFVYGCAFSLNYFRITKTKENVTL